MTKTLRRLSLLGLSTLLTMTMSAASFKNFSAIVNNQDGTLLTSDEQTQGQLFKFGIAVADDGTVSRVDATSADAIATVSGKYHSEHGSNNLQVVVPVEGSVKITMGDCTYGSHSFTVKMLTAILSSARLVRHVAGRTTTQRMSLNCYTLVRPQPSISMVRTIPAMWQ